MTPKTKRKRAKNYEKKVALKEGTTFDDLIKVAVKAPNKEPKNKK